ncbi:MAG: DUF4384 domain-containing protein [Muribaculaceae bacterium]|nr:DUF4384 domain-containing protein [Muribaculaceae bacterium]
MTKKMKTVMALVGLFLMALPFQAIGAEIVSVKGESTFYDDGTHSKVECERLALEQARIDALAKKFGTIVSQDILQADRVQGNREKNDFLSLSSTEVRGEWVADDGDPVFTYEHDAKANLIVTCVIKGKAKAIDNESAQFNSQVLRNGTDTRNADINFRNGDAMFLDFQGSQDGYLAVFLEDEQKQVYQLLPYVNDQKTRVPVKKGNRYVFFSPRDGQRGEIVDELVLTADFNTEYNRVYVLFSPEQFSSPVMNRAPGELPYMNADEFSKWLVRTRKNDPKMGVKAMNLIIEPSR